MATKLLLAALVSVVAADRATLVVRKDLDTGAASTLVQGQNFTVTYTVSNVGSVAATDVKVSDKFDTDDYELQAGKRALKLETLAAGASATHSYVLQPTKSKGGLNSKRAKVKYSYAVGEETKTVKAFSSSVESLKIVSAEQHTKDTSLYVVRVRFASPAPRRCARAPVHRPARLRGRWMTQTTKRSPSPLSLPSSRSPLQDEWAVFSCLALGPVALSYVLYAGVKTSA